MSTQDTRIEQVINTWPGLRDILRNHVPYGVLETAGLLPLVLNTPLTTEQHDLIIQNWLKECNCPLVNGKYEWSAAAADRKPYLKFKLAPDVFLQENNEKIRKGERTSPTMYSWNPEGRNYQDGYHNPTLVHNQALFDLARQKADRTITLDEILEKLGNERHKDHLGNKLFTRREPKKYWTDNMRELLKQRNFIRV